MSVVLSSLTMFTITTSLLMTIRFKVMSLARQAEKPSVATEPARQRRRVAMASR